MQVMEITLSDTIELASEFYTSAHGVSFVRSNGTIERIVGSVSEPLVTHTMSSNVNGFVGI